MKFSLSKILKQLKSRWEIIMYLNKKSIINALEFIISNYNEISNKALNDFNNTFNCNQYYNTSFKHLFPTISE